MAAVTGANSWYLRGMAPNTSISRLASLRAALVEGEQSGEPEDFDFVDFVASKQA